MGDVPIDSLETKLAKLSASRRREVEDLIDLLNGEVDQNTSRIPGSSRRPPRPWPPDPRQTRKKTVPAPDTDLSFLRDEVSSPMTRSPERSPGSSAGTKNPVKKPRTSGKAVKKPVSKEEEIPVIGTVHTDFEDELDMLDAKTVNQMTSRIGRDCKTIIKHFHLDHLMVDQEE